MGFYQCCCQRDDVKVLFENIMTSESKKVVQSIDDEKTFS